MNHICAYSHLACELRCQSSQLLFELSVFFTPSVGKEQDVWLHYWIEQAHCCLRREKTTQQIKRESGLREVPFSLVTHDLLIQRPFTLVCSEITIIKSCIFSLCTETCAPTHCSCISHLCFHIFIVEQKWWESDSGVVGEGEEGADVFSDFFLNEWRKDLSEKWQEKRLSRPMIP